MIRKITEEDRELFVQLAKEFYHSDAVLESVPEKYHILTFQEMMRSDVYVEGYIIEQENQPAGYALTAKTFSQEAGGLVLWIEELYIREGHRSKGLGKEFFAYLKSTLDDSIARVRLEVEEENEGAMRLYKKMGFKSLDYSQMVVDRNQKE